MRSYPPNSPKAAARLVALTMLADGHVSRIEAQTLERLGLPKAFGLSVEDLSAVLQGLCEDLLCSSQGDWCRPVVDAALINGLLAEVTDPGLRATVLRACVAVAEADEELADGECVVLMQAIQQWRVGTLPSLKAHPA
ncbi:TerB family tellurite resistance protein [Roseateles microcysteis]|uniref:TerB family tellurite resistance protein n=1 Tax=Roseateles microcysteis TaxID=3119057 RepID=UPI002FE5D439